MPCCKQLGRGDYDTISYYWSLSVELFPSQKSCLLTFSGGGVSAILRKGYLSESVPIHMSGIGGPGAPHSFIFSRRASLSRLDWGNGQNLPLLIAGTFIMFSFDMNHVIFSVWGSVLLQAYSWKQSKKKLWEVSKSSAKRMGLDPIFFVPRSWCGEQDRRHILAIAAGP